MESHKFKLCKLSFNDEQIGLRAGNVIIYRFINYNIPYFCVFLSL